MSKILTDLQELKQAIDTKTLPSIVLKFKSINKGVKVNDTTKKYYKWEDLIDDKLPLTILRTRVIELNKLINALEPGINSEVSFLHTTNDGTIIPFTWQDTKEFIIESIKYRMSKPEYKELLKMREEALKEGDFKTVARISKQTGI